MLQASLLLGEHTKGLDIVFVDCSNSDIEVLFEPASKKFKIHKKWLDYHAIHQEHPCRVSSTETSESDNSFYCGHIAEELYGCLIDELVSDSTDPAKKKRLGRMTQKVREKIDEMPHEVMVRRPSTTSETWALEVSWKHELPERVLRRFGGQFRYKVTLHDERCASKAGQLLHEGGKPLLTISGKIICSPVY